MNRIAKAKFAEHLLDNMTWPERILWARLKRKQLDYSFQRQAIVIGFIVDFWCPVARVAIELDGGVHRLEAVQEHDRYKDTALAKAGIDLLRFENSDIRHGMSAVLARIWEHCYQRAPLRAFYNLPRSYRTEDNSDFAAFLQLREAKRMERQAQRFFHGYRKTRRNARGWMAAK